MQRPKLAHEAAMLVPTLSRLAIARPCSALQLPSRVLYDSLRGAAKVRARECLDAVFKRLGDAACCPAEAGTVRLRPRRGFEFPGRPSRHRPGRRVYG